MLVRELLGQDGREDGRDYDEVSVYLEVHSLFLGQSLPQKIAH